MKLYKVGGAVRDELLGLHPHDIDYAVEAESYDEMKHYVLRIGGEIYQERPEYLCIRCNIPKLGPVDLTLCRKDGIYFDGRRPNSVEPCGIYEELSRRDFTVNAIAIDIETGEYIDPHNGRQDIKNKLIRCVGDAQERFGEDSLRLLRAIRFSITKGFDIEYSIARCLNDYGTVKTLDNAKVERWYEELRKCFGHDTLLTLKMLERFPVLRNKVFESELWLKLPKLMPTLEHRKGHKNG